MIHGGLNKTRLTFSAAKSRHLSDFILSTMISPKEDETKFAAKAAEDTVELMDEKSLVDSSER